MKGLRGLDLHLDKTRGRLVIVYDDMCHLLRYMLQSVGDCVSEGVVAA